MEVAHFICLVDEVRTGLYELHKQSASPICIFMNVLHNTRCAVMVFFGFSGFYGLYFFRHLTFSAVTSPNFPRFGPLSSSLHLARCHCLLVSTSFYLSQKFYVCACSRKLSSTCDTFESITNSVLSDSPSIWNGSLSEMSHQSGEVWKSDTRADTIRKRVVQACNRCRLKKSRCNGLYPCLRCQVDNTICSFESVHPQAFA